MAQLTPPSAPGAAADGAFLPLGGTVFARDGAAWSEVAELGGQAFRVRLGGLFRPAWTAALCSGLAARHISIDQLHAKRGHDGAWIAELHVLALEGAADPKGVPYIALAHTESEPLTALDEPTLALEAYTVVDSTDHGGTLVLTLQAQDALGLLGTLFSALAMLALYPIEMHVETRNGRANDCLWLVGEASSCPPTAARIALDALLSGCI